MEKELKAKKKKKNEDLPHQIWGKKERLLVLLVLTFSSIIPIVLFYSQNRPQNSLSYLLPKISYKKPPKIENDYAFPKEPENEFTKLFKERTAKLKGVYAYYFYDRAAKTGSGLFADEYFPLNPFINELILSASPTESLQSRRQHEQILKNLGMFNTFLDKNTTTPENISKLYDYLSQNKSLKDKNIIKQGSESYSFIKITDSEILVIMSKGSLKKEATQVFQQYQAKPEGIQTL